MQFCGLAAAGCARRASADCSRLRRSVVVFAVMFQRRNSPRRRNRAAPSRDGSSGGVSVPRDSTASRIPEVMERTEKSNAHSLPAGRGVFNRRLRKAWRGLFPATPASAERSRLCRLERTTGRRTDVTTRNRASYSEGSRMRLPSSCRLVVLKPGGAAATKNKLRGLRGSARDSGAGLCALCVAKAGSCCFPQGPRPCRPAT